jgi:hypothetical protein
MSVSADPWPSAIAIDTAGPPATSLAAALRALIPDLATSRQPINCARISK